MAPTPYPRFYRFGTFELDVQAGELRRNGVKLRLPGQSFQVLLRLLQHPGEVVTREELQQQLWPADTFVDFDEGLNAAVKKLRLALGDSADNPRFVQTLPRRGYRFLCPVTSASPGAPAGSAAGSPSGPAPAREPWWRRTRARWAGVGVLVAVALLAAGTFWLRRPAPGALIRSIAVLPLRNLSNDPQDEYFSQGLTEELTARLASLQGLRVISSTSAMQYKDTRKSLPEIGKELNVDAVVEGSVLRSGGRVRITAELIEASSDRHLWAASYEREQRDILALQNEVTRDIADNIQLSLTPGGRRLLAAAPSVDPQAHENYLQGRFHFAKRSAADLNTAVHDFQQAIALDPGYARAYAGLADSYTMLAAYSFAPPDELMPKARAAALKALEIDEKLPEAHTSLAVIAQNYDWDWPTAEREYRRAIELDRNYATAHHWYAEFLALQGRFDEAFAEIERARQLDPLSLIIAADRGAIFYYARQYDRSVEQFRAVLERDPDFPRAHVAIFPLVESRAFAEALEDIAKWNRPEERPWILSGLTYIYARSGQRAQAERALRDLEKMNKRAAVGPGPLIGAYVALDRRDEAFAQLQQAYRERASWLNNLNVNPFYDSLRGDPRFQDLLRRLNLAPPANADAASGSPPTSAPRAPAPR